MTTPARTEHPAINRSIEIYNSRDEGDQLRDLTDAETTFLASVHLITMRRAKYVGNAVRQWGDLTEAYWCAVRLADRQQADELSLALEIYESSVEALDLIDEIELAQAAE